MKLQFPLLKATDIECRVGQVKRKDPKDQKSEVVGFSLLLYKDARCDMRILDEVVGATNWQRDHKELKGNIYCGVSIYDEEKKQWITKWDAGKESQTEGEKGEASDSFKRACVNIGIGRELYNSPFIWIKGSNIFDRFSVQEIGYDNEKDRNITKLVITNESTGEVAYSYGAHYRVKPQEPKENAYGSTERASIRKDQVDFINSKLEGMEQFKHLNFFNKMNEKYGVGSVEFLSEAQATEIISKWGGK